MEEAVGPVSLPPVSGITNRLLLQFGLLQEQLNKTWTWMESFAKRLINEQFGRDIPHMQNLFLKTLRMVPSLSSADDVVRFLDEERRFDYPGSDSPFCVRFGVFRQSLLDYDAHIRCRNREFQTIWNKRQIKKKMGPRNLFEQRGDLC